MMHLTTLLSTTVEIIQVLQTLGASPHIQIDLQQQKLFRSYRLKNKNGNTYIYNSRNYLGLIDIGNLSMTSRHLQQQKLFRSYRQLDQNILAWIYNSRNYLGLIDNARSSFTSDLQQQKLFRSYRHRIVLTYFIIYNSRNYLGLIDCSANFSPS